VSSQTRAGAWVPPGLSARVALFDLDRTVVAGSSLVDLARVLLERDLVRRRTIVRHSLRHVLFKHRGVGDRSVERVRTAALGVVAGCEHAALAEAATTAGEAVADRAYPAARWLLERHIDAGDFCVLLSAAPQELVEVVASRLGAHRAVGSRGAVERGYLTGELDGPFCYGSGKLTRLVAELGRVDLGAACAYADSASDLPLLSSCRHPVAVNPDKRLERVARERGWPLLRFA